MRVTITATNGNQVLIWREGESFHASRSGALERPQVCLAVDLFEVIAELADLDLAQGGQAAEAIALAEEALRRLPAAAQHRDEPDDNDDRSAGAGRSS
jgi:hypothetical protein